MLKRIAFTFWIFSVALSACGTLKVNIYQAMTPIPSPVVQAGETAVPGPTVADTQPAAASPTPDDTQPSFSGISFFKTTGNNAGCGPTYLSVFPARIRRVYASWKYANMRAGLTLHRAWYQDGNLWGEQDEPWDFVKYGANGTISDIFIYDLDAGLPPGTYELRLTIDGQPQFGVTTKNSFVVDSDWTVEVASPNRLLTAIIFDPQILTLREATGTKWELLRAHEISSLAWFPDSRHMLYTDTDRSLTKGCSTVGIQNRLWVVDASNGDKFQIGSDDENLHRALLSPDGRALVALTGSGWADAGNIDLGLRFFQLDGNREAVFRLSPRDFAGLPVDPAGASMFPQPENSYSDIGVWQDDTHFTIGLNWTGAAGGGDAPGLYQFDLASRRVERIGNLPTH